MKAVTPSPVREWQDSLRHVAAQRVRPRGTRAPCRSAYRPSLYGGRHRGHQPPAPDEHVGLNVALFPADDQGHRLGRSSAVSAFQCRNAGADRHASPVDPCRAASSNAQLKRRAFHRMDPGRQPQRRRARSLQEPSARSFQLMKPGAAIAMIVTKPTDMWRIVSSLSRSTFSSSEWTRSTWKPEPSVTAGMPLLIGMLASVEADSNLGVTPTTSIADSRPCTTGSSTSV